MRSTKSELSCPRTNGKTTPTPRKEKGQNLPGSQCRGYQRQAGPAAPCPPQHSDSLHHSRLGHGRRRLRRGRRWLHPARVRQEGPSGKEGTPPPPPRPHLGSAGGQGAGPRLAPASLGRLPAPPRGGRQMGQPPAQLRRQETAAEAAWNAAAGGGGGAQIELAHPRGGAARPCARSSKAMCACQLGFCAYQLTFLGQVTSLLCVPVFPPIKWGCLSLCDLRTFCFLVFLPGKWDISDEPSQHLANCPKDECT